MVKVIVLAFLVVHCPSGMNKGIAMHALCVVCGTVYSLIIVQLVPLSFAKAAAFGKGFLYIPRPNFSFVAGGVGVGAV